MERQDDAILLRRFIETADEEAFAVLDHRHRRRVHGICARILMDEDRAADATQETFVRVLLHAAAFRGEAKVSTWLYRIAVNVSKNMKRAAMDHRHEDVTRCYFLRSSDRPDVAAEDADARRRVDAVLPAIGRRQRQAIALRCNEHTYREIADVMGCTESTARQNYYRGVSRLAELV